MIVSEAAGVTSATPTSAALSSHQTSSCGELPGGLRVYAEVIYWGVYFVVRTFFEDRFRSSWCNGRSTTVFTPIIAFTNQNFSDI
jgi:hypothetical protein